MAAQRYAQSRDWPVEVVVGSEIKTDIGDIVGVFLQQEITSRQSDQVILEIKEQGGLVVLPHPYKGHQISALASLRHIDAVEVFSGRTSQKQDQLAQALCNRLGAFPLAGGDAHLKAELTNCIIEIDSLQAFKRGRLRMVRGVKSSAMQLQKSRLIKAAKTKKHQIISVQYQEDGSQQRRKLMIKVLLTDGGYKNTLAAVRSLGKRGIGCYVLADGSKPVSAYSKYCAGYFTVGKPNSPDFVEKLQKIVIQNNFDVLLPIGFNSYKKIIEKQNELKAYLTVPIVDPGRFRIAAAKDETMSFAHKQGVLTPKSYSHDEVLSGAVDSFPVVIKPAEESGIVSYARDQEALIGHYEQLTTNVGRNSQPPLVQEYIPGTNGFGFYALYWQGQLITYYIHQRIHMYPRSGGASTMAKTYYHEDIYEQGKKLLDALGWHGVAMVEFKRHQDNGKFYLIEVNPKYWGSLDLAIAAGAEIPYYHVMTALGRDFGINEYKPDVYFRWVKYDMRYALTGKNKILEMLKWFLLFFSRKVKSDLMLTDLKPFLATFLAIFRARIDKIGIG